MLSSTPSTSSESQDRKNQQMESDFFDRHCCKSKCNFIIPKHLILRSRNNFLELSNTEQDLVILCKIESGKTHIELDEVYSGVVQNKRYGKRKDLPHTKGNVTYTFYKMPICRALFLFIYDCGVHHYENLLKHFDAYGVVTRTHGLAHKTSTKPVALKQNEIQRIVDFISTTAETMAMPLPGRLPKFKDFKVMKLPSSENKSTIYRLYISALESEDRKIGYHAFRNVWSKYIPYVTVMKPADDLCDICRTNSLAIMDTKNCKDTVKEQKLNNAVQHLHKAKTQRLCYQNYCSNTDDSTTVLSFDFAQNVHYPHSPQQPGTAYFKAAKKCAVFGITNEKHKVQVNYLIDEGDDIGKGPNCVISLLHNYLEALHPIDTLILFADNCVGQNKNNAVLHYLMWRVEKGKNKEIVLNFLLTGHTKFSPDRFFGVFKSKYARTNIDTFEDLINCVVASSPSGHNKAISAKNVTWYQWDMYLRKFFKRLPNITTFHHFNICAKGIVKAKLFADTEELTQSTLLLQSLDDLMPEVITPSGLPLERQWYLYNNIRSLVTDSSKVDMVAPIPVQNLPKKRKHDAN